MLYSTKQEMEDEIQLYLTEEQYDFLLIQVEQFERLSSIFDKTPDPHLQENIARINKKKQELRELLMKYNAEGELCEMLEQQTGRVQTLTQQVNIIIEPLSDVFESLGFTKTQVNRKVIPFFKRILKP